jgi:hypothetical protein
MTSSLIILSIIFIILWEFIAGPLLAVPKLQGPILLFSWTMHAVLSLIGFVDFGALAFALLFTFIPVSYYQYFDNSLHIWRIRIHRGHLYFMICSLIAIFSGVHFHFYAFDDLVVTSGIIFLVASTIFIWPILPLIFLPTKRPVWHGRRFFNGNTPKWMFIPLIILALYGMTAYLGLRTAGNFSMFSNLRTEGAFSNHLLLKKNPLKVWSYQEDAVQFIKIDNDLALIDYNYHPLEGNALPMVEFKKFIYKWTQAGFMVPLTFAYGDKIYSPENIVDDPLWRTEQRNWEMMLMDFRVIQPDGANRCRW